MRPIEATQGTLHLKHSAPPTHESPFVQPDNNDNSDNDCIADYLDSDVPSPIENIEVPPPTNNNSNDSASSASNDLTSETTTNDDILTLDLDSNTNTNSNLRSASSHASVLKRDLNKYQNWGKIVKCV